VSFYSLRFIHKHLSDNSESPLKKLTKITKLGNGKSRISFIYPLTIFEYLILPVIGVALITLSTGSISEINSLISNILIGSLGLVGIIFIAISMDSVALNFKTLTINRQSGIIVISGLILKSKIRIDQVDHVTVIKERNSGSADSNGFVQYSDWVSSSINLELKNGKSIKLIPIRGKSVNDINSNSQLLDQSKKLAKDIAHLLSVKALNK